MDANYVSFLAEQNVGLLNNIYVSVLALFSDPFSLIIVVVLTIILAWLLHKFWATKLIALIIALAIVLAFVLPLIKV